MAMKVTVDHEIIKAWAEKNHGKPEILPNSETETGAIGIRIDFPGKLDDMYLSTDHKPRHVSWKEFFRIFDDQNLALEYDAEKISDDLSDAYRFIRRDSLD